ncbi:HutD family protein [Pseudogulbenkiania sp. MAI-1]|uniref:HutD/Ves family protein n=1 Tax=Pseudogulbenkiania sp. MAI-1 TaxID=990370 RepID=UPI0004B48DBA|nr:HutD family protein [Pseudogulbenkiania sp. MAI-1]
MNKPQHDAGMTEAPSRVPDYTLIRGAALQARPWKNGGGVTREIAAGPDDAGLDDFAWRVSLADVAQAGPFSRFPGVDRTLVLLAGDGMRLEQDDGTVYALCQPLARAVFAGEAAIEATLPGGATRDFNLMLRRDAAQGRVEVWQGAGRHVLDGDVVLLFCAQGRVELSLGGDAPLALEADDTLRLDAAAALDCRMAGDGSLLAVSIRLLAPSSSDHS